MNVTEARGARAQPFVTLESVENKLGHGVRQHSPVQPGARVARATDSTTPARSTILVDLAGLLVITIWGTSFSVQKAVLSEVDPLAFTCLRYVGMLTLGWVVALWSAHRAGVRLRLQRRDLPRVAVAGLFGYTFYIPFSTVGLNYTTAFSNALLIATAPLFTALILAVRRTEPIGRLRWLGMAAASLGVVLFVSNKLGADTAVATLGDALSLLGAFCFAAYGIVNAPLLASYRLTFIMAAVMTAGAMPILPLTLPAALVQDWSTLSMMGWAGLLWSIVVPVYVAWTIWAWAIGRVGAGRIAPLMYLVPVVGGVTSWVALAERPGLEQVAGAAFILAGLALARRTCAHRP